MPSPSSDQTPAIDIPALLELMGDDVPDILDALLSFYAGTVRRTYDDVAASTGDAARLAAAAHAAKGEARTAGAMILGELYADLEELARTKQPDGTALARIEAEVGRVEGFIAAYTPNESQGSDMTERTHSVETLRTLVAEDNAFTREIMRRLLTLAGVKSIQFAVDGREAMEILRNEQTPIDVAFYDIHMPGMDGIELIRRTSLLNRPPALVIVSASHETFLSMVADLARSRGLTVLEWVVKPISRALITSILTEYAGALAAADAERSAGMTFTAQAQDLNAALAGNEFALHYQPKISAKSGALEGFEALIRWQHPRHGLLWPRAFIKDAVKCGLIARIANWEVETAFAQCGTWNSAGLMTKVSLNLDVSLLKDPGLPARWAAEATAAGVKPNQIIFEIPDIAVASEDFKGCLGTAQALREKGFQLSIDNYGMSHALLDSLPAMPFNEMKIDPALTMNCSVDDAAKDMVKRSAELAHRLGMTVVANGVESEIEAKAVSALGVDILQEFSIASPMPADKVADWMSHRQPLAG